MVIALVTADEARHYDKDLQPVYDALITRGLQVEIHNWDNAAVDWNRFTAAIVRSPWDYHRRYDEFVGWLDDVSRATDLYNSPEIVKWNLDKTYLAEMASAGIAVIPTFFIRTITDLENATDELQNLFCADVVVKPTVSAGSNHTERFRHDFDGATAFVEHILALGKAAMVQPYQKLIDDAAETALSYFNGEYSHAFRKGAILSTGTNVKNGLFVVEDISQRDASDAQLHLGDVVMSFLQGRFGESPLYARVDMVPNEQGEPIIMEVEMAEPSFFFHTAPEAAQLFAEAVVARVS